MCSPCGIAVLPSASLDPLPVSLTGPSQCICCYFSFCCLSTGTRAGIGRTGTFCAVDVALQRLRSGDYGIAVSAAELKPVVAELRRQRSGMVQTAEQYLFCYRVRAKFLKKFLDFKCRKEAWSCETR